MPHGKRTRCLLLTPRGNGAPGVAELLADPGLWSVVTHSEVDALAALGREDFSVVLVSGSMGEELISGLVARLGQTPLMVLGTTGAVEDAIDAMQLGVADYLVPPIAAAALREKIARATRARPRGAAAARAPATHSGLVGSSAALQRVLATIEKISRYKTNVLVRGESGTGKELIARALHASGPRRQHLFVPINCATLGKELLENELFGHEKGAFTGATERKKGILELADGGTLFLDEISEMDLSTQAKLLRVLERNEFRRVGGTTKVAVDLSVVAATNRSLEEAIAAGKFREDLFYRLKVVSLLVPPLRDRKEDIPALIESFIANFNHRNGEKIRGITPEALKRIMDFDWPGNVRELKNAIESASILASGETIEADGFQDLAGAAPSRDRTPAGALSIGVGTTLESAERQLIEATVAHCTTKRAAAAKLGLGLRTLYSKLDRYREARGKARPASRG